MARLIIVTCGKSLSSHAVCWKGLPAHLQLGRDEFTIEKIAAKNLRQAAGAWTGNLFEQSGVSEQFDPFYWKNCWRGYMSAELDTLVLLDQLHPIQSGDELLLLHGPGVAAEAQAIQAILSKHIPWRGHGSPRASCLLVEKLDANSAAEYRKALDGLSNGVDHAVDTFRRKHRDGRIELCLSGGYKGTTAAMLLVAFRLRENGIKVSAYYIHELSKELIALPTTTHLSFVAAQREA